jgi:predicted deacetylase
VLREGVERRLLEVANHGYTHCVLQDRLFRPRLFSGNRQYHREFHDWLPEEVHREHLTRAQEILGEFFGSPILTFIPPGNVFSTKTVTAAVEVGIRYLSCHHAARRGPVEGITLVDDTDVVAIHDRELVLGGPETLPRLLRDRQEPFLTVREIGERIAQGRQ